MLRDSRLGRSGLSTSNGGNARRPNQIDAARMLRGCGCRPARSRSADYLQKLVATEIANNAAPIKARRQLGWRKIGFVLQKDYERRCVRFLIKVEGPGCEVLRHFCESD